MSAARRGRVSVGVGVGVGVTVVGREGRARASGRTVILTVPPMSTVPSLGLCEMTVPSGDVVGRLELRLDLQVGGRDDRLRLALRLADDVGHGDLRRCRPAALILVLRRDGRAGAGVGVDDLALLGVGVVDLRDGADGSSPWSLSWLWASCTVRPLRSGTVTAVGPDDTKSCTVLFGVTSVPAAGFWLMTVSSGTVSLGWRTGVGHQLDLRELGGGRLVSGMPTTRGTATLGRLVGAEVRREPVGQRRHGGDRDEGEHDPDPAGPRFSSSSLDQSGEGLGARVDGPTAKRRSGIRLGLRRRRGRARPRWRRRARPRRRGRPRSRGPRR